MALPSGALPATAYDGLRAGGERCLYDVAGAQGRHHSGLANLRLPRFTGDRIARQAIQYEQRLPCDSPEGRLICDEIARPDEMDAALAHVIEGLSNAGAVSAIGNRRALRIGESRSTCSAAIARPMRATRPIVLSAPP